ncbi:9733_t:CDS:2 [Ambispora leptoticha]|uniref:9733_t:CDS:1 n=1 Tax=Ambispora leptoticha TaxID=144679 RepID=A0A9N9CEF1_9GLOM|nr:9733_t:CDS:2 [Ambispora leptoticha]
MDSRDSSSKTKSKTKRNPSSKSSRVVSTRRKKLPRVKQVIPGPDNLEESKDQTLLPQTNAVALDPSPSINPQPSSPSTPASTPAKRKPGRPRSHANGGSSKQRRQIGLEEEQKTDSPEKSNYAEAESEIDEQGELKVTKDGELLGGRKYKLPVFQLSTRGNTWFMLSMDPAKLLGFRDSYLFFLRNPSLRRIYATDAERDELIQRGILITNFRNRQIALVSARSTFKLFGHQVVEDGKRGVDDYSESTHIVTYENPIKENSEDPPSNTFPDILSKRATANAPAVKVNDINWLHESALSVREFNARLKIHRKDKTPFYDIHTNIEQVPKATQPTRIRVEKVEVPPCSSPSLSSSDQRESAVENEVHFKYDSFNHNLKSIDKDVLEVVPPDIRNIINSYLKQEPPEEDDKHPLALMDDQFQSTYPLHRTRFNKILPKIPTFSQSITYPMHVPLPMNTNYNQLQQRHYQQPQYYPQQYQQNPYYQSYPHQPPPPLPSQPQHYNYSIPPTRAGRHTESSQYTHYKSAPQFLCGVLTASTGQPCRRSVSFEGERCQFHKHLVDTPNRQNNPPVNVTPRPNSYVPVSQAPTPPPAVPSTCVFCHNSTCPEEKSSGAPCSSDHMIKCAKCLRNYHPLCLGLKTPKLIAALESYPWQCNDCKLCVVCRTSGDEASLLICDDCDRGWHTGCCVPIVTHVPQGNWLCSICAKCHSCEKKVSSHSNEDDTNKFISATIPPQSDQIKYSIYLASYCTKCYDNFIADRFCPLCLKTYSGEGDENEGDDDNDMVCCDRCDRWIHCGCDEILTPKKYQELVEDADANYQCPLCDKRIVPFKNISESQLAALSGKIPPVATPVAKIAGTREIRGIVGYKEKIIGVPPISGWGTEDGRRTG